MNFIVTVLFILSLDGTRASSSSSIRGGNLEKEHHSSDEEIKNPLELDSNCPVFTENPYKNPELTKRMIDSALPCGTYKKRGCRYEVIPANVDHPGEGPGDLDFIPYIVQFDIGVHKNIKEKVMADSKNSGEGHKCIGCEGENGKPYEGGETCLELIVKGNSDVSGGCAGKCGGGCIFGGGWAKDCLKHDVCVSYKALVLGDKKWEEWDGFCYDIDCGDEAAQTILNCYINDGYFNDSDITCEPENFKDSRAYGHWSTPSYAFGGPCYNFVYWRNGQGLPDKNRISNPYEFLAYLESKGVDVSRGYEEDENDIDISRVE